MAEEDGNGFKRKKFEMPKPIEDPAMSINPEENPTCKLCNTFDIDHDIRRHYNVPVCRTCCEAHPERFSLITKTEARTDYMLTDPELNDKDLLPRWEKPNPRKTHWSNMFLYLREQVEEYAFKKWGGEDAMDAEFERREAVAKDRKDKKFKKELSDLRRRTRTSTWQKDKHTRHVHSYGPSMPNGDEGSSVQKCVECGMEIECEEF